MLHSLQRSSLLEELAKVQATPEELSQLTSLASIQTKGLKRHFLEQQYGVKSKESASKVHSKEIKLNSIKGAKRKRLELLNANDNDNAKSNDPNVVGFESDSNSDTDDEIDELEVDEKQILVEIKDEPVEIPDENGAEGSLINKNTLPEKKEEVAPKRVVGNREKLDRKPAVFVEVDRSEEIQKARLKLPILAEEQQIMETINESSVIIIAGETGTIETRRNSRQ